MPSSQRKFLGRYLTLPKIKSQNFHGDFNLPLEDTYFVNLDIVNTSKGICKSQAENLEENERQRIEDLEKFRSSRANEDCSKEYLATTIAQLSRRDKIPGTKAASGSFKEINPILNKSIRRVLIYGSPGTGKTTLCKKIVNDFYKTNLWNHLQEVIWIPLRQLKDPKFEDEELNEKKLLAMILNEDYLNLSLNNCLYILDGWDEIQDLLSDPKKAKLVETINKIKDQKNVILTSRPYVQLNFADYQRVLEIKGFTDKNVRDYIKTVLKQNNRLTEQEKIMEFINNNLLSDLVTIPIILEIFLFAWHEISTLDKNDITTTKLYEIFILKFLKDFIIKSGKEVPENPTLRNLINGPLLKEMKILREMARKWLENGSLQFMYKDFEKANEELERKLPFLNSSSVGEDWKSERSEFVHLTFLEFFAAFELINREEEDFRQFISENKFNPKYFVVLTFVAGLIHADLHNLKEFGPSAYRYSKEEKLELYFDYLLSDAIDLSGKYIYMLLVDCLNECQLSKSREMSIYQEIVSSAATDRYYSGIGHRDILPCLRQFPLGLLEELLKNDCANLNHLAHFKYKLPQFTDKQVETIFKCRKYDESTKLEVLCKQSTFSAYCSDIILKLTTFDSVYSSETYSNLPLKVLEKMLKLIINKELFETAKKGKKFKKVLGVSCQDAIILCSQLVKIEKDDSIQDIILKLVLSRVEDEKLFFLEDVQEFVTEMPRVLLEILNNDQHESAIYERTLEMIRVFKCSSQHLIEKLLQMLETDEKLKYQTLKSLSSLFHKTEMPAKVAALLFPNFKSLLAAERERLSIQSRLLKNYMLSIDRKPRGFRPWNMTLFKQTTCSMKEWVTFVRHRSGFASQLLIEMFLGTPVSELPLDILKEEERGLFNIFPFVVESKSQDGNLHMKTVIINIINSKEEKLKEMVNIFDANLISDTIKEILTDITGKERSGEWKWTIKRIFYTLMEMQRSGRHRSQYVPKECQKNGDEKCVYHASLLNSEVLGQIFDSEDIKLDKTIMSLPDAQENLFDTMTYICFEKINYEDLLLGQLLSCGVEDSEYQDEVTRHMVEIFSQDLEMELKCQILAYLSERVHRLTKYQLIEILKYEGDEKDYELNETSNEDRCFLSSISTWAKTALLANHKFVKDCEYFSEDEQLELRKFSPSYDKFCRESDHEMHQLIEEFISEINEIMARSQTKDIINVLSEYMKSGEDELSFTADLKLRSIDPNLHSYLLHIYSRAAHRSFPECYTKQFLIAYLIFDQRSNLNYAKFHKISKRFVGKSFSLEIMKNIYEKLDDDVLGGFFLNILERKCGTKFVSMVKCIHESSSEKQKSYMTYALMENLISLHDNVSVYVYNNDLYMGSSVSDKPAVSNLNQNQLEVLFKAKSIADYNGFNIKLCGIAQNIENYEKIFGKCTVADLSDKEKLLKNKKYLDLSHQNIKESKEIEKIFNFIKKYQVETLVLSNNQITGEMFEFIIRNANETYVKHLILHSNSIDLDKFDFGKLFQDKDSHLKSNKTLLLLDISNNLTSIDWLENFDKMEDAEKFSRKDSKGNVSVQGYTVNNANIILYRSSLTQETGGKCQIM